MPPFSVHAERYSRRPVAIAEAVTNMVAIGKREAPDEVRGSLPSSLQGPTVQATKAGLVCEGRPADTGPHMSNNSALHPKFV